MPSIASNGSLKKPYQYQPKESSEQLAVVGYLRARRFLFHCSPGGAWMKNFRIAQRMKQLGSIPGFPDIMIFNRLGSGCGMAIEMKRRSGGKVRLEQIEWLDELSRLGWIVKICKGADEAIAFIEKYYGKGGL